MRLFMPTYPASQKHFFCGQKKLVKRILTLVFLFVFTNNLSAQNAIVTENLLTGNPSSEWEIPGKGAGDLTIQGFATDISVNRSQTINFKINTAAASYTAKIYRLGYYQGNGARFITNATITAPLPQAQPACVTDPVTGLVDCGNWTTSAQWAVPGTAVSGIYILRLQRTDIVTTNCSHIVFIVRDDASTSDLYYQTSDATWQAYNGYGGYSLYTGSTAYPGGRAVKVSYNRPITTRGGGGGSSQENFVFNAEYPMVRWLERNGYDVSYTTNIDADRNGSLITNHKVFLSVGHDEYWSAAQRTNVENARNAGIHLAFFSGNEVYWKTRYENSVDGNNTPYKTLVCYKEGVGTMGANVCTGKCDPLPTTWTGLWRDGGTFSPVNDGNKPENTLTGQISEVAATANMIVPDTYKNLRFWRNTSVASLASGQKTILPFGTLGYEFDYENYGDNYPSGRITMSSTIFQGRTHKLSLYKHINGANSAWVFGAGTIQWSWGLDDQHDQGDQPESADMQQATVNLFADMSVQPGTLQLGLVPATASTDVTAPSSAIVSPVTGANAIVGSTVTITGTATDANAVAGVEISIDGGTTWHVAEGTTSWAYTFMAPATAGAITIKCRGYDDSGNMQATAVSGPSVITLNVIARPSPDNGFGGPILVVSKTTNPFSKYAAEILRAEGLNEFDVSDISLVTPALLNNYDVVVLGEMTISAGDVTNLTNWVNAGGTLIAFKPDAQLATLMGITPVVGSLSDRYILISNTGAGVGIVNQTIQYHGSSDFYSLNGATSLATLYSAAATATIYSAITTKSVGSNGGQAIAFSFDLAKSIIYTRQGNPAWEGQNRDGLGGPGGQIRPNDLFFGNFASDPQPDWIDFNKVAIPQADEQQRLLANIIIQNNLHRKPLPRFWYLPSGHKAAVVLTSDGHANGGAFKRYSTYITNSGTKNNLTDIADWKAIRGTVYLYPNAPFTNPQAKTLQDLGFELSLGFNNGCNNFTPVSLETDLTTQLGLMTAAYPSLFPSPTLRTECAIWSDWATMAKKEAAKGVHLDLNYNYMPDTWIQDRPGMLTGSGLPMRFADTDGTMIDTYQMPIQISEDAGQTVSTNIEALLNKAIGAEGFYGTFAVNMLADFEASAGADIIIAAAQARNIPVISASQMLTWLDGRNNSSFTNLVWNSNTLTFVINTNASARNIKAMLPALAAVGLRLKSVSKNGTPLAYRFETIKGIEYAFFDASNGNFTAVYEAFTCSTPTATITASTPTVCNGNGAVSLQLSSAIGTGPYSVVVNGVTYNDVLPGVPFKTVRPNEVSIWDNSVVGAGSENIYTPSIELGVKFRSSAAGYIAGIRFYKLLSNEGPHTGSLWNSSGTLLGTVTFTGETESGWQYAKFTNPIFIAANTTYIASYFAPHGQYSATPAAFQSAGITNGPITLLQDGVDGPNGVFKYGAGAVFPDDSYNSANYWVDVVYVPNIATAQTIDYTLSSINDLNNCSNAGPSISTASVTVNPIPCSVLPVELLDFSASVINRKTILNWTTVTEINNAGFEVERSTNGISWKTLGFVKGAGTTYMKQQYQFTDGSVLNGKYLYRLKQIDLDNKIKYSKVLSVTLSGNLTFELGQNYPNPTHGEAIISYSIPERTNVFIALYDLYGRTVQVLTNKVNSAGTYTINVNTEALPKGEYFYRMQAGTFSSVKKLVVQ